VPIDYRFSWIERSNMVERRRLSIGSLLAALAFLVSATFAQENAGDARRPSQTQTKSDRQGRVTSQQSITVEARLTPEEKEDGDLNDAYQPVYSIQQKHDCKGAIEKYRTVVIPSAERAKFEVPKNKYLYLAYRGVGDCDMDLKNFAEAEAIYQKLFDFIPIWPGTDDSDYPITFRSLGYSRMAQERWADAEEPLRRSVAIFDDMIAGAAKSDKDFVRNEMANNYRMSQDSSLYFLAVVYFREKRNAEALASLERAYNQATQFHAPAPTIKKIVDAGVSISVSSLDVGASVTWSKRALDLK
jgi:tetratricopeptide (TPR) repeat protein